MHLCLNVCIYTLHLYLCIYIFCTCNCVYYTEDTGAIHDTEVYLATWEGYGQTQDKKIFICQVGFFKIDVPFIYSPFWEESASFTWISPTAKSHFWFPCKLCNWNRFATTKLSWNHWPSNQLRIHQEHKTVLVFFRHWSQMINYGKVKTNHKSTLT